MSKIDCKYWSQRWPRTRKGRLVMLAVVKGVVRMGGVSQRFGLALVLLGVLRAALLVTHEPLMGYANQYDMHRTSACIGLFPANESIAPWSATPAAPMDHYRLGTRIGDCYFSTEVVIAGVVAGMAHAIGVTHMGIVKLQWIGGAKFALFVAAALLIASALHSHPGAAMVHGLVVFLVLGDPVVTLWFNTLYTEFGIIWSIYASIGAVCAIAVSHRHTLPLWALFLVALVALAFSREQFSFLGPALVGASWWWLWHRSKRLTVAAMVVALATSAVSYSVVSRPVSVRQANRADVYLGVVLPASLDPTHALSVLKLPARCATVIGANWYLRRGEKLEEACPEVFSLSSIAFMRFIKEEPTALLRSAARVLPLVQGVSPAYLGTYEGVPDLSLRGLPWWAFSPLDAFTQHLPASAFVLFVLGIFMLAPLVLMPLIILRRSRKEDCVALLLAMLLGGVALYTFITTVFGDGFSEAARHNLVGALAMFAALIAAVVGVPLLVARWYHAFEPNWGEIATGVAVVALAACGWVVALDWARSQPLAIGVLVEPTGKLVSDGSLALRGWALDPYGIERVDVQVGQLERKAGYGLASPDHAMVFPGYPDAGNSRFALDIPVDNLVRMGVSNPLRLRILVRNRNGVVTEVDGRNLEFQR